MRIESGRFGTLELNEREIITFPDGLIGFAGHQQFILLRRTDHSPIGWLQSTTTAELALPVVSIESLAQEISVESLTEAVTRTHVGGTLEDCAVMAVICALGAPSEATVNLLAPIIVNAKTRQGAQIILDDTSFTTTEPFCLSARRVDSTPAILVPTHERAAQQLDARP